MRTEGSGDSGGDDSLLRYVFLISGNSRHTPSNISQTSVSSESGEDAATTEAGEQDAKSASIAEGAVEDIDANFQRHTQNCHLTLY